MISKTVEDSYTVMTEIVLQGHANGAGRLFGGQLMSWMDIAGAICAKRHCENEVVTASAHQLEFLRPVMPNDVIVITASMISVGNTSMKVQVNVQIEDYSKGHERHLKTCSAISIYDAIDKDGVKHTVPGLAEATY